MAREIQQIMTELETAYAPQRQAVQERMNQLPGFYEAQRGGVETARTNAYQDITRQANARGMVYSGAPIQEQQRYTGERYLPALAQLSGQEGEQRFGLQQALNQLGERQLTYAQQIRSKEQELDEERRRFDLQIQAEREAELRAAKAAARGGGGGGLNLNSLLGPNNQNPQAAAAANVQVNPLKEAQNVVRQARQALGGGNQSWGAVANYIQKNMGVGQIQTGSVLDQVLNSIYAGRPVNDPGYRPMAADLWNAYTKNKSSAWLGKR
jgi:hypothetical protein